MASVIEVSKSIIQKSSVPISNLKLQKLLYYVQGWSLALHDRKAFPEEIQAWVHGPVVPRAFYEFKDFRWNSIDVPQGEVILPTEEMDHIQSVLDNYNQFSATQLESLSHEESPWIDARKELDAKQISRNVISTDAMKEYFSKLANA